MVDGMTKPMKAKPTRSSATSTGKLSTPASVRASSSTIIAAKPATDTVTSLGMPKRWPRVAANCEAPMKPTALTEKAKLYCVGVRPKWSM